MYGRDVNRPFVEVICHSYTDITELAACVATEWAAFAPTSARLHTPPGAHPTGAGVLDQTVYAARCADIAPPDHRVTLDPFADVDTAVRVVAERYARSPTRIRNWRIISPPPIPMTYAAGMPPGNCTPSRPPATPSACWLWYTGHRFAASAQAEWAHRSGVDPDRLLVGTIDRLNTASHHTARRAGRRPVIDAVFISLTSA